MASTTQPLFFESPAGFAAWLEENQASADEILVGFKKRSTGLPSMTWEESVDVALCLGWIDGARKSFDAGSYTIRFTPRRPNSIWSRKNLNRVKELISAGEMLPSGMAAYEARDESRSEKYSYEQSKAVMPVAYENRLRESAEAWDFFSAQPPSYRKPVIWWVISAKREETRLKRLDTLIADSAKGQRLDMLSPGSRKEG